MRTSDKFKFSYLKYTIIAVFSAIVSLQGAAKPHPRISDVADGALYEYTFDVGEFSKIKVSDNVNVVYRCNNDSAGLATYVGAKDFEDSFIFTNNKGELRIQVTTDDVNKPGLPTIYVYSKYLSHAENSGDFTLTLESPAPGSDFKAVLIGNGTVIATGIQATNVKGVINTGNGTLRLSGSCDKATYVMVGTGNIQADNLSAKHCECKIFGGGSIDCWAHDTLRVKGIGSTRIFYKGSPVIRKSGGGKLAPLPARPSGNVFSSEE